MIQEHSLGRVIQKVSADYKPKSSAEQLVIVDNRKKKIIPKKPLLGGGNLLYYLVKTTKDAYNVATCENLPYRVLDFASKTSLDLLIDYQARCHYEQAEKLALSLSSDEDPVNELDRKLLSWVSEIIDNKARQFIDNYSSEVKKLESQLQNKAKTEIGLNIDVRIHTGNEDVLKQAEIERIIADNKLKAFAPETFSFDVKVSDYDDNLNLKVTVILEVDEDKKEAAAAYYGRESLLINLVKDEIRKYLLNEVKIGDIYSHLNNLVSLEITKRLNDNLRSKGRKVGYLSLATESIAAIKKRLALKEFLEIKNFEVGCSIKGYERPIIVINTLQLLLKDIGKYNTAVVAKQLPLDSEGKPNLEAWAKEKLETIVKPLLLEKEYVDILLDFEPIGKVDEPSESSESSEVKFQSNNYSEEVRQQMRKVAEAIGYSVEHIVSVPDLEPFKLKGNCTIETGEREYATKDANVRVKLNTVVVAKIENLRKVKDLLNPERSLQEQMGQAIHESISRYLNGIEPERFYMRFNSHDESLEEKDSVEQELITLVKKELEENFKATVSSVIPKMVNTDIIDLFTDLRGQKGHFEIGVESLRGGESVKFQGKFQVVSVEKNSWYKFQSKFQSLLTTRSPLIQNIPQLIDKGAKIIANEDSQEEFEEKKQQIKLIRREASGINEIEESIQEYLKAKLDTLANEELEFIYLEQLNSIEQIFNAWVNHPQEQGSILNQFGLQIHLFSVSRSRTELESKRNEARQKLEGQGIESSLLHIDSRQKYIARLQQELDKLYEKRLKLIDKDDNEIELEDINRKINAIEKELTPSLEEADSKLKRLEPERRKGTGFEDIAQQMNLIAAETHPSLKPSSEPDEEKDKP